MSAWTSTRLLSDPILNVIGVILGDYVKKFDNFYTISLRLSSKLPNTGKTAIGKLAIVRDSELKYRVIAVVDYYSQFYSTSYP